MNLRAAGVWTFAAFFLLLCGAALGDGKMFSPATAFVEMPEQSAVLAFDGQVQQLVISTAFDGPGGEYAWVVPLPAVPEVGRVSDGVLPTLHSLSRPRLVTRTRFWIIYAWVGVCLWAAVLVRRSHLSLVLFLIGMIAVPSFLPHLFWGELTLSGTLRGMEDGAAVTVHQRLRVGEYDVATLTAESAQDLLDWLAENGFQVSDGVGPVLSDYIRDGWCFTAYRFHPESGAERSHPLSFTFPAERAVYPLRLTAVDSDGLDLELYVFGNEEATAKGLARRRCGFLRFGDSPEFIRYRTWQYDTVASVVGSRSERAEYDHEIYVLHEGVEEIAKPYRVMTTLAGHLTPEQMASDLYLEWRRPRPYRVVVYSPEAAASESRWRGAVAFLAATVLGVAWVGWKTYARRSVRVHVAWVVWPVCVCAVAAPVFWHYGIYELSIFHFYAYSLAILAVMAGAALSRRKVSLLLATPAYFIAVAAASLLSLFAPLVEYPAWFAYAGLAFIAFAATFGWQGAPSEREAAITRRAALAGLACALLGASVWLASGRVLQPRATDGVVVHDNAPALNIRSFYSHVLGPFSWHHDAPTLHTEAEARELIAQGALEMERRGLVNPHTGEPFREEDSPGNYHLALEDGRLVVYVYDANGAALPHHRSIPILAEPPDAQP